MKIEDGDVTDGKWIHFDEGDTYFICWDCQKMLDSPVGIPTGCSCGGRFIFVQKTDDNTHIAIPYEGDSDD